MIQIDLIQPLEQESEDLALHVDVCAQRYGQLITKLESVDQRFDRLETVVQEIHTRVTNNQTDTLKTYLTWAGVIITGLISATGYLLATFVIGK